MGPQILRSTGSRCSAPGVLWVLARCSVPRAVGSPDVLLVPAGRRRSGVTGSGDCP